MVALLLLEEPEKKSHPKGKARYTLQDIYKDWTQLYNFVVSRTWRLWMATSPFNDEILIWKQKTNRIFALIYDGSLHLTSTNQWPLFAYLN